MRLTYPSRRQNHRGSGRNYTKAQHALTRLSWGTWLEQVLALGGIGEKLLLRELADRKGDHDSEPRSLLRDWLMRRRTVSEGNAFRVGEALRRLGVAWCSGPLSLYAARHYSAFLSTLRYIWSSQDGRGLAQEFACGLYIYAPVLVEFDLNSGFQFTLNMAPKFKPTSTLGARERKKYDLLPSLSSSVGNVRAALARATSTLSPTLEKSGKHLRPGALALSPQKKGLDDLYLQPALQLLQSKAPPTVAWRATRELLDPWFYRTFHLQEANSTQAAASLELWGEHYVWGALDDGTLITGSILKEHRDLLDVIEVAQDFERYKDSELGTARRT